MATALPLFAAPFAPITDLPEHVAAIATLRHWLDPSWHVPDTYVLSLGKTEYLLYHVAGALLAFVFPSAEAANRALLVVVAIAFPYSTRALLRARGGDERLAVFACIVFWSRPLRIGFLPYVASVPCVLFALAWVVRQLDAPTRARAMALAIVTIAIFYVHASGFLVFAFVAATLAILHGDAPLGWRTLVVAPARVLWLVPASIVAAMWALHGEVPVGNEGIHDASQVWSMPLRDRLHEFPLWAHDIWISHGDDACAVVTWLAIGFVAAFAAPSPTKSVRRGLEAWAPFLCTLVLYLVLPTQVGAAASVNERLSIFFPIFLVLVLRPRAGTLGTTPLVAAGLAACAMALVSAIEIRSACADEVGDFDAVLAHLRPNAKLVTLTFKASSTHTTIGPWFQMGSYHRAREGGVSSFSFDEIAHWPIHYRKDAAPPPHHPFWEFDPCVYRNAVDGAYYDYVLTRGGLDPFRDAPPGPKWREVAHERDWRLYEKIPGETNPAWSIPDVGPCESRWSAEHR